MVFVAGIGLEFAGPLAAAVVRNGCALEQARDRAAPVDCSMARVGANGGARATGWCSAPRCLPASGRSPGSSLLASCRSPVGWARRSWSVKPTAVQDSATRQPRGTPWTRSSTLVLAIRSSGIRPARRTRKPAASIAPKRCYLRGIDAEQSAEWAAGRYYLGVLYFKQGRWPRVVETLEPLTSGSIEWRIRNGGEDPLSRLADWAGGFLLLGIAQENRGGSMRPSTLSAPPRAAGRLWRVEGKPRARVSRGARRPRRSESAGVSAFLPRARPDARLIQRPFVRSTSQTPGDSCWSWSAGPAPGNASLAAGGRSGRRTTPDSAGAWLILALTRTPPVRMPQRTRPTDGQRRSTRVSAPSNRVSSRRESA